MFFFPSFFLFILFFFIFFFIFFFKRPPLEAILLSGLLLTTVRDSDMAVMLHHTTPHERPEPLFMFDKWEAWTTVRHYDSSPHYPTSVR